MDARTEADSTGPNGPANQGFSVAISADASTAIVGGYFDASGVGAVWVYTQSVVGEWSQQGQKLVGTGGVGTSEQGFSVALAADGNTAIVGGRTTTRSPGRRGFSSAASAGRGPSKA